jgi:hypothetical protein
MLLRLSVVVVLAALFLMAATSLLAAEATGTSPDDGLAPTCTYQPLDPGASVWIKVPYRFDYRLQFTLDSNGVGGFKFAVYPSDTAAQPVGIGTYNLNEPTHDLNWEGRLQPDGYYYVLVTNTNAFAASYRFCSNEKLPFYASSDNCVFNPLSPRCPPASQQHFGPLVCTGQWYYMIPPGIWWCTSWRR